MKLYNKNILERVHLKFGIVVIFKVTHHSATVYHNLSSFCTHRAQFISDKHGIRINSDYEFDNGKLCLRVDEYEVLMFWHCSVLWWSSAETDKPIAGRGTNVKLRFFFFFSEQCVVNLTVENTGTEPVYFTYYTPLHWLRYFTLMDKSKVTKANPLHLQPGNAYIMMPHVALLRGHLWTQWTTMNTIKHSIM